MSAPGGVCSLGVSAPGGMASPGGVPVSGPGGGWVYLRGSASGGFCSWGVLASGPRGLYPSM